MNIRLRPWCVALLLASMLMLWAPGRAEADAGSSGGDLTVAQTLGDRELTVVLRRVTSVPGPLHIDVVTHDGTDPGRLSVAVVPTGTGSTAEEFGTGVLPSQSGVELGALPGSYPVTASVDRPGPWELLLGDGSRTARIPFVVPAQVVSPPERLVYGGFLVAGVSLVIAGVVSARVRHGGWALLPAGGVLVGVAVGVTAAVLSASLPLPPQPGAQLDPTVANTIDPYALGTPLISDFSRPPVTLTVGTTTLKTGVATDVPLDLSDGATGLPVDDLVVHGDALIHLLMVGPTGQLWHLHPIRTAPGRYQLHVSLPVPGRYAMSAELARRGGGVQLVRVAGLEAAGVGPAATASAPSPLHLGGDVTMAGTALPGIDVEVMTTPPVAGVPVTLAAQFGTVADLQPWLGMVGHMIVAGPLNSGSTADLGTAVTAAPVWAHGHSMGGMPADHEMHDMSGSGAGTDPMMSLMPVNGDSAPDETVAGYGPDIPFTFTFPAPGSYRVWLQAERDFRIITVPLVLDVAGPAALGSDTAHTRTASYGITVTTDRPRLGRTDVDVTVTGADSRPVPAVAVQATMPLMGYATTPVVATRTTGGHYLAAGVPLMVTGPWQLLVSVGAEQVTVPLWVSG